MCNVLCEYDKKSQRIFGMFDEKKKIKRKTRETYNSSSLLHDACKLRETLISATYDNVR